MSVLVGCGAAPFDELDSAIELERIDARITPAATHFEVLAVRG
jgi:hypothetical protein